MIELQNKIFCYFSVGKLPLKALSSTSAVSELLGRIFSSYSKENSGSDIRLDLSYTEASRLWYRAGLKHSCLDDMLKNPIGSLSFCQFLDVVKKIIEEDVKAADCKPAEKEKVVFEVRSRCRHLFCYRDCLQSFRQVGDKVELVEDFERFLDEPGGPLKPGDRGTVVELQNGHAGER